MRTSPIREILDEGVEQQGWDDESIICILTDFIAIQNPDTTAFQKYLNKRILEENQA